MKTYFVDSFTNQPFKGNPAGVCFLTKDIGSGKMLNIAKEIGFSETAFVSKTSLRNNYRIRYFSPKKEIPLCGHATLAAAEVIFKKGEADEVLFLTVENVKLGVRKSEDGILMSFPVYDTISLSVPASMFDALGLERISRTSFCPQNQIIIIEIDDSQVLANLKPDFNALLLSYENINGVLVTAPSGSQDFDFHYRYFWPWSGTNEDPVTGGVQTFLAKYWVQKLKKTKLKAFQSSERTGFMTVELKDDKVHILGNAVIVFEGDFIGLD
jgi:PhzF family phenazine biosynthesis protein